MIMVSIDSVPYVILLIKVDSNTLQEAVISLPCVILICAVEYKWDIDWDCWCDTDDDDVFK
jgi:hypothetical protein